VVLQELFRRKHGRLQEGGADGDGTRSVRNDGAHWDQACAYLNYGLLHEDLFFETSGEFFGVWERVKPIIPQARQMFQNKDFLGNLEKATQRFEAWSEKRNPGGIAHMRQFMKQMREQMTTAAKA
jgi:hypothetical protein